MQTKMYLHVLFFVGFALLLLIGPLQVFSHEQPIGYIVTTILGYSILLLWSLFTFFVGKRDISVTVETILGFILSVVLVPAIGRTMIFIMGRRSEYDEKWFIDDVLVIYIYLTSLSILLGPLLSKWWNRRKEKCCRISRSDTPSG